MEFPDPPKNLYKYVTAQTAKIILTSERLRWSHPSRFNDPFDTPREIRSHNSDELIKASIPSMITLIESTLGLQLTPEKRKAWIDACRTDEMFTPDEHAENESRLEAVRQHWRDMHRDLRILCLSGSGEVTPMWAHYADNSSGVALRFECIANLDPAWMAAKPINYTDELPRSCRANLMDGFADNPRNLFEELCFTKNTLWKYEQEWRVLTFARPGETGDFSDWKFNPLTLGAVILGSRISDENRSDILLLLKHNFSHVELMQAKPGLDGKLLIEPATEGWANTRASLEGLKPRHSSQPSPPPPPAS